MPTWQRAAVSVCLSFVLAWFLPSAQCWAAEVWSGLTYSFTKPDDVDGTLPQYQDTLTPGVVFARGNIRGLYNAATEPNFLATVSPEFTEWATDLLPANVGQAIDATNWANLTFEVFAVAYGGQVGFNAVGRNAVVHLVNEDIYLDLRITVWTDGHQIPSGGFAYLRAEPPTLEPSGDYSGNGFVDAADYTLWRDTLGQTVANPGDGADGNRSGTIDLPDYDHWKARFGNVVPPGAGGRSIAVPEPSALSLWFGGLLTITTFRRLFPRGPGQTF